ncbi:TetR/AcrR family transcriptional regulator [Nonomuraea sp. B10E15]|uniref:TetR/AcrR family transcriptional regulator n=1 Tax=Nonomuraea sp. B10E15 TaxID=3153560 RepID=UPI00325C942C
MAGRPRGGTAEKRQAILNGASTVFARDGYVRAGIESIAKEAGVSTRTIYNHFTDKASLFQAVIQESAARVQARHSELIDRHLRKVTDIEADLVDFALAFVAGNDQDAGHFALIRQIRAETEHIPRPAVEAWLRAGPLRVRSELAARLASLPGLRLDDAEVAALHLMALIAEDPVVLDPPSPEQARAHAVAAVRAFLRGYAA